MFKQIELVAVNFADLFILSAPWLLFGFFMAAMIKTFLNTDTMQKHLGGNDWWSTVKAALIGAPLPLCSCGVVPAALGLRSAGASKNATVSFLVATPETGVDSVSFTYALMGPVMAVARPVAAITSAIVAGLLVGKTENLSVNNEAQESSKEKAEDSCCASKAKEPEVVAEMKTGSACCASKVKEAQSQTPLKQRLQAGLQFAFGKMLKDVVNWLTIGLIIAALVQTFLPSDFFEALGDGFLSMLVMAVIGIPMYVCASASTPIAAGFLLAGLSPGAVLVFMLLGPASNIGTIMIVKKELGTRAVSAYFVGLIVSAFFFGFALNFLTDFYQWNFVSAMQIHAHDSVAWYEILASVALASLMIKALAQNAMTKFSPAKLA
jgi:uncharacterized membrane protein YraQ (UPF0718 family)